MPTNLQKTLVLITSLAAVLGLIFTQSYNANYPSVTNQTETFHSLNTTSLDSPSNNTSEITEESFAVVELFTSQGCSSCPPADYVLRDLIEEAEKTGKAIYGLSFHVDYWNYLGWKDPYSHSDYSNRQRHYNQQLRSRGSYTPQMIVNGVSEFVGSKRALAYQEVANGLGVAAKVKLQITKLQLEESKNQLEFDYQIIGDCDACKVHIAAVESNLKDAVKRGENHGRTLRHDNVVRGFETEDFKTEGKGKLDLPKGMVFSASSLVVYVQEATYGKIVGATKKKFK